MNQAQKRSYTTKHLVPTKRPQSGSTLQGIDMQKTRMHYGVYFSSKRNIEHYNYQSYYCYSSLVEVSAVN